MEIFSGANIVNNHPEQVARTHSIRIQTLYNTLACQNGVYTLAPVYRPWLEMLSNLGDLNGYVNQQYNNTDDNLFKNNLYKISY